MMNKDEIGGNWKQFKGKAKEKWGKLTDDDMTVIEGKRDQAGGQNSGTLRLRQRPGRERSDRLGNQKRLSLVAKTPCFNPLLLPALTFIP
ncbi:putative stress-response protein [Klebsiella michiganensis]|nr:putative stress-response protein [Klebsiella michiganensis]